MIRSPELSAAARRYGPHLRDEDLRVLAVDPVGPHAQGRVLLRSERKVGQRLIAPDIGSANRYNLVRPARLEQRPVRQVLLLLAGEVVDLLHEQHFGPVQPDARDAIDQLRRYLRRIGHIDPQPHGQIRRIHDSSRRPALHHPEDQLSLRRYNQAAVRGTDENQVIAGRLQGPQVVNPQHGKPERLGQDRRVRQSRSPLYHKPHDAAVSRFQYDRRQQFFYRQHHRIAFAQRLERLMVPALHPPAQPRDDIPDVAGPLDHDGVLRSLEYGNHPAQDRFDGRFRRQGVFPDLPADILMKLMVLDEIQMGTHDLSLDIRRFGLQLPNDMTQFLGQTVNVLIESIQLLLNAAGPPLVGSKHREITFQEGQASCGRSWSEHFPCESAPVCARLLIHATRSINNIVASRPPAVATATPRHITTHILMAPRHLHGAGARPTEDPHAICQTIVQPDGRALPSGRSNFQPRYGRPSAAIHSHLPDRRQRIRAAKRPFSHGSTKPT